jgi:hypothetical protein
MCLSAKRTTSATEPVSALLKSLTAAMSALRYRFLAASSKCRKSSPVSDHIECLFNQYRRNDACFQSRSALMMTKAGKRDGNLATGGWWENAASHAFAR